MKSCYNMRDAYRRNYLVIYLKDERFPLLIKLSDIEVKMKVAAEWLQVEFTTGYMEAVDTLDAVKVEYIHGNKYGQHYCTLSVKHAEIWNISVEAYDEGCEFIGAARDYYAKHYGVSYERK